MSDMKKYNQRLATISKGAEAVRGVCINPQFNENGQMINNPAELVASMREGVAKSPLFESIGDNKAALGVATTWATAIREYSRAHGEVRDEVLACAAETLGAMLGHGEASSKMFESTGLNTTTSEGVMLRAKTAALILPTLLATTTGDAATYMQGGRDESEVFRIRRTANTAFGDVKKGEVLEDSWMSQYSSMKQVYESPVQPDGAKEKFIVYIYNEKAPVEDAGALVGVIPNQNPKVGAIAKSVRIMLNGREVASSILNGTLFGSFDYGGKRYNISESSDSDVANGKLAFQISPALPAAAGKLGIKFDVDIEHNSSVIPEIAFSMESFIVVPHQSIIASGNSIQSYWRMSREYGLDLRNMNTDSMRNVLAYNNDMQNLTDMLMAAHHTDTMAINLQVAQGAYFKEKYEEMHQELLILSESMLNDTRVSGLVGLFAGPRAAAAIKALGAPFFVPVEGYRQVPRPHYCGLLFGKWKIYEVPKGVSVAGYKLADDEMLAYARGSDFSQAGLLAGDAVPATLYRHNVDKALFNRDTLWKLTFGDIAPVDGYKFFRKVRLILS
ncbi:hypothetical protein I6M29_22375 [Shewanella algae]|uniref:hypothetical protein n=1 Tax=Shewanella algae TaxID=38313 RepID=UPI001AB015CC|nr:hypothetical protein [Shewanella algae]MBO2580281.1 hypothetical protein [Shewanella algae]